MSAEKKRSVLNAAAQAMDAIMGKAKTLSGPTINDPSIVVNTRGTQEVIKGNQKPSFVWVFGPCMVQLNATAARRLPILSKAMGAAVNKVGKVRVAHKPGTKVIYVWPADDDDPDAYEVMKYGGATWINLVDFMAPRGLTVDSGFKESFAFEFTKPEDAVHPALKFDMEKRLDRATVSKGKKQSATPAQNSNNQPDKTEPGQTEPTTGATENTK